MVKNHTLECMHRFHFNLCPRWYYGLIPISFRNPNSRRCEIFISIFSGIGKILTKNQKVYKVNLSSLMHGYLYWRIRVVSNSSRMHLYSPFVGGLLHIFLSSILVISIVQYQTSGSMHSLTYTQESTSRYSI